MNVNSQKTYLVSRLVNLIVVSFAITGAAIAAESDATVSARSEIASITASSIPARGSLEASGFATANQAAEAFAKTYAAKGEAESVEYNAGIVKSPDGTFGYAAPISGSPSATTVNVGSYHRSLRGEFGSGYVALAHTSLDNESRFSPIDVNDATIMPIYQVLNSGQTWRLDNTMVRDRVREEATPGPAPLRTYLQRHEGMSGECVSACG